MNNNGFVIYTEYKDKTKRLSDEQLGKLLRCLFDYKQTGEEPDFEDIAIATAFDFIRADIDRQNDNYEKKVAAGKKGGEAKAANRKADTAEPSTAKQTVADSSKSSKTDNYNYNNNKTNKEKSKEKDIAPEVAVATLDAPAEVKQRMQEFVIMRKSIKKPMTGNAVRLMYGRLQKLSKEPSTQCEILEQSIRHSWQDVYELKDEKPRSGTNKFNNIIQHDWNMDELERKLLGV